MNYSKQVVKLDCNKYTNDLSVYDVVNPEFILVYITGGNSNGTFPIHHVVPWWTNQQVTVAVFEITNGFEKHGMPAKFRSSTYRQTMLLQAIRYLSKQYPNKSIMCFGHSFGSIESAWLSTTGNADIAKIVISNGTWAPSSAASIMHKDGFIQNFSTIKIPTLILHHTNDLTEMCPYGIAEQYMKEHPGITVTNGYPHVGDPGTMPGPHFYTGQEAEVFKNVKRWIQDIPYQNFIE